MARRHPRFGPFSVTVLTRLLVLLITPLALGAETVLVSEGSAMSWVGNLSDPGFGMAWTDPAFAEGPESPLDRSCQARRCRA